MTRIPAFNIMALGLKSTAHRTLREIMDPLFNTLYTVSLSMQIFLFLSTVYLVYFTDLLSSPLTLTSFSGSAVLVYGTIIITNASKSQDPTWECFIDNSSIGFSSAPLSSQNNWVLCGGGFQDGPHVLTVKANVSDDQTFWFDQIQYDPSASVSLNQPFLRIDSNDSAIQYSSGWEHLNQPITYAQFNRNKSNTQVNGSYLTYQFHGS
jgi:hypothetical protein